MITVALLLAGGISLVVIAALVLVGRSPRSSRIVITKSGEIEVRE